VVDLSKLTGADFQAHLHQAFCLHLPSLDPIELELHAVTDLGPRTMAEAEVAGRRRPFSLVFLGPPTDLYLSQATYTVVHAQMGEISLFLVPLGPTAEQRMRYEAVFT
jgi:hypothetical protein